MLTGSAMVAAIAALAGLFAAGVADAAGRPTAEAAVDTPAVHSDTPVAVSPVVQSAALPSTWQRVVDAATLGVLIDYRLGSARRHCATCLHHATAGDVALDGLQRVWAAEGMSVQRLSSFEVGDEGRIRLTNLRPISLQLSTRF